MHICTALLNFFLFGLLSPLRTSIHSVHYANRYKYTDICLFALFCLTEPTSALDATTSELVEKTLVNEVQNPEKNLKAIIWITHSEEQSQRVATRTIQLTPTKVVEEPIPDV